MRQTRTSPWGFFGLGGSGADVREGTSRTTRLAPLAVATALVLAAAALWIVISMPAAITSFRNGQTDIPPQTELTLSVWNLGGTVQQATLHEAIYDIDGNLGQARDIPVNLVPVSTEAPLPWRTTYRIERTDGSPLMAYDALYRVTMVAGSVVTSFAGQHAEPQTYLLSSLPSPRLRVQEGVLPLNYQKPAELVWNRPVESFSVETVPPLDVRTWIDPARKEVGYVELIGAKLDTQYEIRVVDALAVGGGKLVAPISQMVATPAPPALVKDKVTLEDGYRILVPWDRAITSMDYEITPPVGSMATVGLADPWLSQILLQNPRQGQEYKVKVKGAVATTGAPSSDPLELKITTPRPVTIEEFVPEQSRYGVPREADIKIRFDEPVKDRAAAEAAIRIEPAVPGRFEWTEPNLVTFVPAGILPHSTDFVVKVTGGREGIVGSEGGYLDETASFTFWTAPNKLIEVNLTAQKLVLWEDGHPIWSSLVSTGVRGAETPTGLFHVEYKMVKTRMRGTNPSGKTYDLPDVPWVMPFLGDYAIHGAYWRETYGTPQSNGCVSMPTSAAKYLYDAVPEGTPVRIHY